jgi:hypothetical protein
VNDEPDITAEGAALGPDQGEMRERRRSERGGRRRSRNSGPTVAVISWRDIPAQLTGRTADDQHKVLLHARFQHAIDRAAAVAGLTSTDAYVQEWRTATHPLATGDVEAQLDQECASLEDAYPRDRLEALVANGGLEPASGDGRSAERRAADAPTDDHPTLEELDEASDVPGSDISSSETTTSDISTSDISKDEQP